MVSLGKTHLTVLIRDGIIHDRLPPVDVVSLLLLGSMVGRLLLDGKDPGVRVPPQQQVEGDVQPPSELFLQVIFK